MWSVRRLCRLTPLLLMVWCAAASGGVIVRFEPPDQTVALGSEFTVQLLADFQEPVLGWGLDLTLTAPAVASLDPPYPAPANPLIAAPWLAAFAPDGDGLAALAFPEGILGEGYTLATFTFNADQIGETDLLASYTAGDLTEGFPLDPAGFVPLAEVTFQPGHVTVVPEPHTAVTLLAALAFAAATRRRNQKGVLFAALNT